MSENADLIAALRGAGLAGPGEVVLEPLAGGVSCDVWKVDGPRGAVVVKRPLEKLRVAADWHAPVERSTSEVRWLRFARAVAPGAVPEVLAEFPALNAFAIRFVPGCPVWKDQLIAGRCDPRFAARVGQTIGAVHSASANDQALRAAFPDNAMFRALRVDPFLLHVAAHNPVFAAPLRAIAAELLASRVALVHGDVSPKNILVGRDGPILIDAECAVISDPAFDLAFCLSHLLLKTIWLNNQALQTAAAALVDGYAATIDWEPPAGLLRRAVLLTAGLLLARVDGKSPAPYLTAPEHKDLVRRQAGALLRAPQPINAVIANWERTAA